MEMGYKGYNRWTSA